MKGKSLISSALRFISGNKRIMAQPVTPARASQCCENSNDHNAPTYAMYETLKELCQNNATFFRPDDSENGQRLYQGFMGLMDHIDSVWPLVDHVRKVAPEYDLDAESPGNGYRSFVAVVDSCVLHATRVSRQLCSARASLIFRKAHYVREVESCGQLLASLGSCLHLVHALLSWAPRGQLFSEQQHTPEELFTHADAINQYCFYGRCLGFQFVPSMRGVLKGISICMAGFSEAYYKQGNFISSVWTGGQYVIDPEIRARRIVNISQSASVEFCKAFWFLGESELMTRVPSLVCAPVAINTVLAVPPEAVVVARTDGTAFTLTPPRAHLGPRTLHLRLLSHVRRHGMVGGNGGEPASDTLLLHIHGGGFVAQSSRSHEVYLRSWAAALRIPILSVDYSLAPHAPFPRAPQDCFYAYCWALANASLLGFTGERVVVAGDSAGGNLAAGLVVSALRARVPAPCAAMLAYAPLQLGFAPSPARLLALMDPLLPFGFMMRCLKAYACPPSDPNNPSTTTTPEDSNGFLKVSPTQADASWASSAGEQSASSPAELQARPASHASRRRSSDTTASAASLLSDRATPTPTALDDVSQQYVADFLERYAMDNETDSEGKKESNRNHTSGSGSSTLVGDKPATGSPAKSPAEATKMDERKMCGNLDAVLVRSPSEQFSFSVPRDPLLSPHWADDSILAQFPPTAIVSTHLDPCLDDCVEFARRLRRLGARASLDVLEGLPHGFLNFRSMSKDADEGSKLCARRIAELIQNKPSE